MQDEFSRTLSLRRGGSAVQAPETISPSTPILLGAGDLIVVRVPDLEEIDDKTIPIDQEGNIDLPKVDRIKASGLNTEQLAQPPSRRNCGNIWLTRTFPCISVK